MNKTTKTKPGKLAPEDVALFRATVGAVKPLPEQNRVAPQNAPRRPRLRAPIPPPDIPDTFQDSPDKIAPDEFLRNGLSRMTLRKLRRGTWPIQDSLDLHGNNTGEARKLLQAFLHEATQHNLRCVRVIHGKGLNSQSGEAILRKLTRHWLVQHRLVLGYCDAQPVDGGSGAVLILLKTTG